MDLEHIRKQLGLRIKAYRKSKNYSQEAFCEIIELEQSNLSNIETGKNFPDITTLFNIINKAKIEPDYILDFLIDGNEEHEMIDYEIMDMLSKLPEESKTRLKKMIQTIITLYEK